MRAARTVLVVLVVLLLASAAPASAASGAVVVYTDNSSSDFSAGTFENTTVSGSGTGAVVEIESLTDSDGFEDGSITDWSGDTGQYTVSATSKVGSNSLYYSGSSNAIISKQFTEAKYDELSFWIRDEDLSSQNRPYFYVRNPAGNDFFRVFIDDGGTTSDPGSVVYYSGTTGAVDTGADVTLSNWFRIEAEPDWTNDSLTLNVYDSTDSLLASKPGLAMDGATGGFSTFRMFSNSGYAFYIDEISFYSQRDAGTWTSQNRTLTYGDTVNVEVDLANASATGTVEVWNSGSWTELGSTTWTTSGNRSLSLSNNYGTKYRTTIELEHTGANPTAEVEGLTWHAKRHAPTADESSVSPSGGGTITESPVTFTVNVSDADFAASGGESLTAQVVDDSAGVVGSDTVNANGTATVEWAPTGGDHDYHWEITDQQGNTITTSTYQYSVPATLFVRNETNVSDLVDDADADLTIRVYGGNQIVEKKSNDGKVNMTGFPVGTELVISAAADGYYARRIIVDSVLEQRSIYLLPENESAVYNEFQTVDRTGLFSDNTTKIYIEKGINNSSTTQWQTVAGDYRGASSRFGLYLQQDARYRVFVENNRGDVRNLGPYIASSPGTVELEIGNIIWESPAGETWQFDAYIRERDNAPDRLVIVYEDPEELTESLRVRVYERGNESNELLPNTTETDVTSYGTELVLTGANESTQWVVDWSAERNGSTIGNEQQIGGVNAWDWPIDEKWATPLGMAACIAFAAWFPSTKSRVAALMTTAFATGLAWLGIVPIPMPIIGLMGALSLIGLAWEFGGIR